MTKAERERKYKTSIKNVTAILRIGVICDEEFDFMKAVLWNMYFPEKKDRVEK